MNKKLINIDLTPVTRLKTASNYPQKGYVSLGIQFSILNVAFFTPFNISHKRFYSNHNNDSFSTDPKLTNNVNNKFNFFYSNYNIPNHNKNNNTSKQKFKLFIGKIFNLKNLLKAIIIFLIRYSILYFTSTDVFDDYSSIVCICYYSFMSYVVVIVNIIVDEYCNFNVSDLIYRTTSYLVGVEHCEGSDNEQGYPGNSIQDSSKHKNVEIPLKRSGEDLTENSSSYKKMRYHSFLKNYFKQEPQDIPVPSDERKDEMRRILNIAIKQCEEDGQKIRSITLNMCLVQLECIESDVYERVRFAKDLSKLV